MKLNNHIPSSRIGQKGTFAHQLHQLVLLTVFAWCCVTWTSASANNAQSLQEIQQTTLLFLKEQYPADRLNRSRIDVMPLDPRLRFPSCRANLEASFANPQHRGSSPTVKVVCPTPKWQVYVSARVQQERRLWVAAHPIHRGERIAQGDMQLAWKAAYSNYLDAQTPINQVLGAKVLRTFRAGDAIPRSAVCHVCKGDRVVAEVAQNHLLVKVEATAMQSGLAGDRIWARNWKTKRQFRGTVLNSGRLRVELATEAQKPLKYNAYRSIND